MSEAHGQTRLARLMAAGRCYRCGRKKPPARRDRQYCRRCQDLRTAQVRERRASQPPKTYTRACKYCGGPFTTTYARGYYCRPECEQHARTESRRASWTRYRYGGCVSHVDEPAAVIEARIAAHEARIKAERQAGLRPGVEAYAWQRLSDPVQAAGGSDVEGLTSVSRSRARSPKSPRSGGMEAA